jgi:hypothetical protein
MLIKNKPYPLYSETRYAYATAGQDQIGSYIVKDVCIHNPENVNRRGPLLCGVVVTEMRACTG